MQNLSKPADWSEGESFNSGALVRRPSNGLLYSANKNLNGTQNTEADFANNWTLASTWVEGVAVNVGDTVYKDGNLYSAIQSISAADNSATNLANPTFLDPLSRCSQFYSSVEDTDTSLFCERIGSVQGNGPHASEQGDDWRATRTYDYGQIVHYQGSYYRSVAHDFNNKVSVTTNGNTEDVIITPGDILIPRGDNSSFLMQWSPMTNGSRSKSR